MKDNNDIVILNVDRPRVVWFGHKALKTLGRLLGKTLSELSEYLNNPDFDDLEKIMYCAFLSDARKNNETLNLEDIEDILDFTTYSEITNAINEGVAAAFGAVEGEEKN